MVVNIASAPAHDHRHAHREEDGTMCFVSLILTPLTPLRIQKAGFLGWAGLVVASSE